jgi:hypothetical protein
MPIAAPDSASKKWTLRADMASVIISPAAGWRPAASLATTVVRSDSKEATPAAVEGLATPRPRKLP